MDVVLVVESASGNDMIQGTDVDATDLPVPADVVVYTAGEWDALQGRMREVLRREVVWVTAPE